MNKDPDPLIIDILESAENIVREIFDSDEIFNILIEGTQGKILINLQNKDNILYFLGPASSTFKIIEKQVKVIKRGSK